MDGLGPSIHGLVGENNKFYDWFVFCTRKLSSEVDSILEAPLTLTNVAMKVVEW